MCLEGDRKREERRMKGELWMGRTPKIIPGPILNNSLFLFLPRSSFKLEFSFSVLLPGNMSCWGLELVNGLRVNLHPLTSLSPINILSLTFQFHSQEYRHEIEGVRKEKERLTAVQQAFDLLTAEVNPKNQD